MFRLTPFWNRIFCFLTIISQGPSFLRPGLYKSLHTKHHRCSDSDKDPHSPHFHKNIFEMMTTTLNEYLKEKDAKEDFPFMVKFFDSFIMRFSFVIFYCFLYLKFTDSYWYLLLVPIHSLMGPIHGAIVNWFGHKKGYRNFETNDYSKNTFLFDFLMMGELYQNNHHAYPTKSNFSMKKGELDLTYLLIFSFRKIKILY